MDRIRRAALKYVTTGKFCFCCTPVAILIGILIFIRFHGAPIESTQLDFAADRVDMNGDKVVMFPNPTTTTETAFNLIKGLREKIKFVATQDAANMAGKQLAQPEQEYNLLDFDLAEKLLSKEEAAYTYKEIVKIIHHRTGPLFKYTKLPVENPKPLEAARAYYKMPQLRDSPRSRCPVFQILSNRKNVEIVIGIPTVKRQQENYLTATLKSLILRMDPRERQYTLIVICIGEIDLEYIVSVATAINEQYPDEYGKLIEIISPSPFWYPDWSKPKMTLGDLKNQWMWRTKQNLDILFLMTYCQSRGDYFLIVEDDTVAKHNYRKLIMQYVYELKTYNKEWLYINFSSSGGSGKLFSDKSLVEFTNYLQETNEMPFDWLLDKFVFYKNCGPGSTMLKCLDMKSDIQPTYYTELFVHIGIPIQYYDEAPSVEYVDPFDFTNDIY